MASIFALFTFMLQLSPTGSQLEVNAVMCQDASRSFLITCLTIAAVVAILAVLLKRFLDRRQSFTLGLRLGLTIALAFALSSALVAWNPLKDAALLDCLESEEFSRYVIMAHVAAIPRGLVLGGVVAVGFYLLLMVLLSLLGNLRKR
ncbi:MAG: hypothetical protein ACJ74W_22030 [Pyrinomonadaceae bacterium]